MKKLIAIAALLAACGHPEPAQAPTGAITDVVVVLKGSSEPLPFDPRGGRLTIVTRQISGLVGHPIVLELDTALSPELRASLEETVLASFETIARELVMLQKDDPEMFAVAKGITRVECHYDAVAKESDGELTERGTVLTVTSPPDNFPLLERGVLMDAVYDAHIAELDKRFANMDPTRIPEGQREAWFTYATKRHPYEHVGQLIRFSATVDPRSALGIKVRKWLVDDINYLVTQKSFKADYGAWLNRNLGYLDQDDKVRIARKVFDGSQALVLPGFDRFGFGMGIYDDWLAGKVHGELEKLVVCPQTRRGEAETEIHFGCSRFFPVAFDESDRFADVVVKRNEDHRLLEIALLNLGYNQGPQSVAFVTKLAPHRALFEDGVRILFHDHQRRDDVKSALDEIAPKWWRDLPNERGLVLLIMGRRAEDYDPGYGDERWRRFTKEFGGPVERDVMTSFFAEGPRAIEMAPQMWLAFQKGTDRDELVAQNLPALFTRPSAKVTSALRLLRRRYCDEKDASGMSQARAVLDQYARSHPDAPATVSNAVVDFTLQRCAKSVSDDRD